MTGRQPRQPRRRRVQSIDRPVPPRRTGSCASSSTVTSRRHVLRPPTGSKPSPTGTALITGSRRVGVRRGVSSPCSCTRVEPARGRDVARPRPAADRRTRRRGVTNGGSVAGDRPGLLRRRRSAGCRGQNTKPSASAPSSTASTRVLAPRGCRRSSRGIDARPRPAASRSAAPGSGCVISRSPTRNACSRPPPAASMSRARPDAALGHRRDDRRQQRRDRHRARCVSTGERPQVAAVDADDRRARRRRRAATPSASCTSTSAASPQRSRASAAASRSSPIVERRDDQQHRVGAVRRRLDELILGDDEVLAQERDVDRRAHRRAGARARRRRRSARSAPRSPRRRPPA